MVTAMVATPTTNFIANKQILIAEGPSYQKKIFQIVLKGGGPLASRQKLKGGGTLCTFRSEA